MIEPGLSSLSSPLTSPCEPGWSVERLTQSDAKELQHLHTQTFPLIHHTFTYSSIDTTTSFGICVRDSGLIVAEVTVRYILKDSELALYIATLSVGVSHRRQGLGSVLLRELQTKHTEATGIYLHVHILNSGAIRFYQAHGFECLSRVPKFYGELRPKDAYVMAWRNPRPTSPIPSVMKVLLDSGIDAGRFLENWGKHWEVQGILKMRVRGGSRQYLLKWRGYAEPTWEDASNLNCPELIAEFLRGVRFRAVAPPKIMAAYRRNDGVEVLVQHGDGAQEVISSSEAKRKYPAALLDFLAGMTVCT
jgi:ribosomal protein S18 acetylase RimI-like enzyme